MIKLPEEIRQNLTKNMKRPIGSLVFKVTFNTPLFDIPSEKILYEHISGLHYFRIEKMTKGSIVFHHSSPGTGTRCAQIDISEFRTAKQWKFFVIWSPQEIKLHAGPVDVENPQLLNSAQREAPFQFRVLKSGGVYRIGDEGIEVMGAIVTSGDNRVLEPTALETWKETLQAVDALLTGKSDIGHLFDVARANQIMTMFVTGYESYNKKRVIELEGEGYDLNWASLSKEKEKILNEKSTYFQNLDNAKGFWLSVAGIKVNEIVKNEDWAFLKTTVFPFRHNVTHDHPLAPTMPNPSGIEPVFPTNEIIRTRGIFDSLVRGLHAKTLKIDSI